MKTFFLVIILLISAYIVVGGISNILIDEKFEIANELPEKVVSIGDEKFRNIEKKEASDEYDKMISIYPMYAGFGQTISYLITLICFGILGATIRLLFTCLQLKVKVGTLPVYTKLLLGGLIGLLVIVISEILPDFKYESGSQKIYYTMALIGGLFTEELFAKLQKYFNKRIDEESKNKNNASG